MSHTIRIYNNPRIKAPRYNIDNEELHIPYGIPFTKRSWICMGHCPIHRDPNREPRLIRKRNKENFRFILKEELNNL